MTPKIKIEGRLVGVRESARNPEREYAAIEVPSYGGKTDTFKVEAWKDKKAFSTFKEGETVSIEAFVHSRKWKNEKTGTIIYFVDFDAIIPVVAEKKAAEPEVIQADEADDMPF